MNRTIHIGILIALLAHNGYQYLRLREIDSEADARARSILRERARRTDEFVRTGQWLHAFYQADDGLRRPQGLCSDGPDFQALGAWLFDTYESARLSGASEERAREIVAERIRRTDEWRTKHRRDSGE